MLAFAFLSATATNQPAHTMLSPDTVLAENYPATAHHKNKPESPTMLSDVTLSGSKIAASPDRHELLAGNKKKINICSFAPPACR
jgi:hypothetical protein